MAEEQTIMERLFRTLDDKAKSLNEENGQSFIENLGLAMEDVYRNQRTLLEQATFQRSSKSISICLLELITRRKYSSKSSNYTRFYWFDFRFLVQKFTENNKELQIVDIASGAGHLSATVNEVLKDSEVMHHLIEVDPVLSRVSVHLANF